ncbi:CHAT domain protein [Ceratobasidium sp. AG-Ba]|nr:CHAT domain protein [Ceratobasidium sp. AG-Ba]
MQKLFSVWELNGYINEIPEDMNGDKLLDGAPAISRKFESALELPDDDEEKIPLLRVLTVGCWVEFSQLHDPAHLEEAIKLGRHALGLIRDGTADKAEWSSRLGVLYRVLFDVTNCIDHIHCSIDLMKRAIQLTDFDHFGELPARLCNLAGSKRQLFELSRQEDTLLHAVKLIELAVDVSGGVHLDTPYILANMIDMHLSLYMHKNSLENAKKCAFSLHTMERWMNDRGEQLPVSLVQNLGRMYSFIAGETDQSSDWENCIRYLKQVPHRTIDSEDTRHPYIGFILAESHLALFDSRGQLTDVAAALEYLEHALASPINSALEANCLMQVGRCYIRFAELGGGRESIDQAIKRLEIAADIDVLDDWTRYTRGNTLAEAYRLRFDLLGNFADNEKSISLYMDVNCLSDVSSATAASLNGLGDCWRSRFNHTGDPADIKKSIKYLKKSLLLAQEGTPHKAIALSGLGNSYQCFFKASQARKYIVKSIDYIRQAVLITSDDHPHKPRRLNTLALAYGELFQNARDPRDLEIAMSYQTRALELTPITNPEYTGRLDNTATASPLEAFANGMALVDQVAWLGSPLDLRYQQIAKDVQCMTTDAVAAAISFQRMDLAIEWLEAGRTVIWNQLSQLRSPLADVSNVKPELAMRYQEVCQEYEAIASRHATKSFEHLIGSSTSEISQRLRRVAIDRERIINEIRSTDGLQMFLSPMSFLSFVSSPRLGDIVVINMHRSRCDAIVLPLNAMSPVHVPLPAFSYDKAIYARNLLLESSSATDITEHAERHPVFHRVKRMGQLSLVLQSLWTGIVSPLLNRLGYLDKPDQKSLPRLIWCTTGPLTTLPTHAAGCYRNYSSDRIYNYAISSYTPNLSALIRPERSPSNFRGIIAIGHAYATGSSPLPGTTAEINSIEASTKWAKFTRLEGRNATVESTLRGMEDHSWVHLACHATQNLLDPNASAFQLHDGDLTLASITQKSLPYADFAFLSACETAKGDPRLPDEVVHLAAGMIMAGYSSVVGTM